MAKNSVSKLIAKGDMFAVIENGKYITVSNYDDRKNADILTNISLIPPKIAGLL